MIRWIVFVSGILGFLAVMIGAYAAHGLEASLHDAGVATEDIAKKLDQCDVAVRYHMTHTLALALLGLASTGCKKKRTVSAAFFLIGMLMFSGGLYSMVFLDVIGHWAIVPCGGLAFMIGWVVFALLGLDRMTPTEGNKSADHVACE